MHNYILVDIVEVYEGHTGNEVYRLFQEPEFVGHNYIVGCYSCDKIRIVREDTFNKMVKLGLIEEVNV